MKKEKAYHEDVNIKNDKERDDYLKEQGIKVLRYSNLDVNANFDAVCSDILNHIR